MHELGGDRGAVPVGVVDQAPQPREVRVVGRRDLAGVGARDRVGDRDRPDDQQAGAAARPGLVPRRLGVADGAVGLAEVRPHRAQRDAVRQLERPEAPGREQPLEAAHHSWSV